MRTWLANISIGSKLALAFGVVIGVPALVGAGLWLVLAQEQRAGKEAALDGNVRVAAAADLREQALAIALGSTQPGTEAATARAARAAARDLAALRSRAEPGERPAIARAAGDLRRLEAAAAQVRAFGDAGPLAFTALRPPSASLDRSTRALIAAAAADTRAAVLRSDRAVGLDTLLAAGLGLVAVALAALLGWVTARNLGGRAGRLAASADRLAAGALDAPPCDPSRDELGRTAAAFRRMCASLAEQAAAARAIAAGEVATGPEPRSAEDELGVAFAGMTRRLREVVVPLRETTETLGAASRSIQANAGEASSRLGSIVASAEIVAGNAGRARDAAATNATLAETATANAAEARVLAREEATRMAETLALAAGEAERLEARLREGEESLSDRVRAVLEPTAGLRDRAARLARDAAAERERTGLAPWLAEDVRRLAVDLSRVVGTVDALVGELDGDTQEIVETVERFGRERERRMEVYRDAQRAFERLVAQIDTMAGQLDRIGDELRETSARAASSAAELEHVATATVDASAFADEIDGSAAALAETAARLEELVASFRVEA